MQPLDKEIIMVIKAQEVGDPRLHTVVQANIKSPRK